MSKQYDNTNSGALFKNDTKAHDSQPDYRGTINIGGVEHWLSAWIKTSKKGAKYMSLSAQLKQQPDQEQAGKNPEPARADDFSDDIPF